MFYYPDTLMPQQSSNLMVGPMNTVEEPKTPPTNKEKEEEEGSQEENNI